MKLSTLALTAVLALPSLTFAATEWTFTSKTATAATAAEKALKSVAGVEAVKVAGTSVTVTGSEKVNTTALEAAATKAGLTKVTAAAPATTTTTTTTTTAPAAPTTTTTTPATK